MSMKYCNLWPVTKWTRYCTSRNVRESDKTKTRDWFYSCYGRLRTKQHKQKGMKIFTLNLVYYNYLRNPIPLKSAFFFIFYF